MADAIAIMAKAPLPGLCKTRLTPVLGPGRAAQLYGCFLLDTVQIARRVTGADVSVVCPDEAHAAHLRHFLPPGVLVLVQEGEGLMAGLASAFTLQFARGYERIALIDGDSPTLPHGFVADALQQLASLDVVLGPCDDGGYYLVAARAPHPELFLGVSYHGETICRETATRAESLGLRVGLAGEWYDVDTPEDYERLATELREADGPIAPHTRAFLAR